MVYSVTLLYNFSGGWSLDHFYNTVQDLVHWLNSARKSGCSSSIVTPKAKATSAKCALPPASICMPPNFLMMSIPRRRSNPNGLLFTTSPLVFKGFLLVTVKVMLRTPWLRRHFLPAFRIAVLFRTLGWHNIPLTTDEEQPESTDAIQSIPLTFTFITGSTSSSLCEERVVPASYPLPRFPDTLTQHVFVAGTNNSVSPGVLFMICSWATGSLWQSDWDLHTRSTALRLYSVCQGLKVGPQAQEEEVCVTRPPQQQAHRPLSLLSWELEP